MPDQKFQTEFNVSDEEVIEKIIKYIAEMYVHNLDELRLKAAVAKNVEWSYYTVFFGRFTLEDISDEAIATMLENIENRLQWISGLHK